MPKLQLLPVALLFGLTSGLSHADDAYFPFAPPMAPTGTNITDLSAWNTKPAGKNGFVTARAGHLFVGDQRIRFFGVNIVAASAFPDRDEANQIAARLARFGINIVRLHHLDTRPAPEGLLQADMRTLDPAQLARLDYFIHALEQQGIYIDLNLHVGRTYPVQPDIGDATPKYWKGVDNFYPEMIRLQKDYAADLLKHVNPHTGRAYAQDPGIAVIEINNENGLVHEWHIGRLDRLSGPYLAELQRRWQGWLQKTYGSPAGTWPALRTAPVPPGPELLDPDPTARPRNRWMLQSLNGAAATLERDVDGATRIQVSAAGTEPWHVQLHHTGLQFDAAQPYTLKLRASSPTPRTLRLIAAQNHAPWKVLWQQTITLDSAAKDYQFTFWPADSETDARITINGLGNATGPCTVSHISLHQGNDSRAPSTTADATDLITTARFNSLPPAAQRDWLKFLWETEDAYWSDMLQFVKKSLSASQLIIGTQVSFSPTQIQQKFDIVDAHSYWDHPTFKNGEWDKEKWEIKNTSMIADTGAGTIAEITLRQPNNKPFFVTEYNHPAPNIYQAEAFPLISAYGSLQDWDGIFVYSYGAHDGWKSKYIENYFDTFTNPVKMIGMASSAAAFRGFYIAQSNYYEQTLRSTEQSINTLRSQPKTPSAEFFGLNRNQTLITKTRIDSKPLPTPTHPPYTSETNQLTWGAANSDSVTINTEKQKGIIGSANIEHELNNYTFKITKSSTNWGTLFLTEIPKQNRNAPPSTNYLLTALGNVQNSQQRWNNSKKTSLGLNWGQAPVLVDGLSAIITLPYARAKLSAWALDESGNRKKQIPVAENGPGKSTITIDSSYQTLWYEIEATR